MIAHLIEQWWYYPFLAGLVLISVHTYLGLHVISRKVLFVDLALAQIAALGSSVTFLYDFEPGSPVTYYVSLFFAVVGAWVFSVTRTRGERVPQEAIIGLSFAIASAGSILLSAENPHGAEHLQAIMTGSILVVTWPEIRNAAILYAVIGAFHWMFRDKFLRISADHDAAEREGIRVRRWDFLFYVTFAFVITMSVHIAGVLLVFCLLIAPAVCGALFSGRFGIRLLLGWGASVLAMSGGFLLTARTDWPPAPCIIVVYAALLIASGLIGHIRHAERRGPSMLKTVAGAGILVAAGWGLIGFLKSDLAKRWGGDEAAGSTAAGEEHTHGRPEHGIGGTHGDLVAALADDHENVRAEAAENLGKLKDPAVIPELVRALKDPAESVKEKAAVALGFLGRPEAAPPLEAALAVKDEDEWVALREAEALVRCGGAKGMTVLIRIAAEGDAGLVRAEALKLALLFAGRPAVADPGSAGGKAALKDLAAWWKGEEGKARWDAAAGKFVATPQ